MGKIPGGEKGLGEYSWWEMFRGGNNRGGTFLGEFSGGEFAGHRFCPPLGEYGNIMARNVVVVFIGTILVPHCFKNITKKNAKNIAV